MNPYHNAMEHCIPPEGLRERVEQNVLSSRPEKARTFKPKRKKKAAVLLLAAALILTTGAATVWDPLFVRRFGPQAALSALGGAVFQEVNVTSVCDDVSLTVTQALCSNNTIYCILEYKLPDGFELGENELRSNYIRYYGTGDYSWEDFKALEGDAWAECDWSDFYSVGDYYDREDYVLAPYDLQRVNKGGSGQGSGSGTCKGYDPETNILTWMYSHTFGTGWDLTQQPLTILMEPPEVRGPDGTETAVTDHPAIVTFQPVYDGPQALSGTLENGDVRIQATLSPFALSLEAAGLGYPYYEDMVKDARLVTSDGTEKAVSHMGYTNGGSSLGSRGHTEEVGTTVHFILITDTGDFVALRVGDYEVPLN